MIVRSVDPNSSAISTSVATIAETGASSLSKFNVTVSFPSSIVAFSGAVNVKIIVSKGSIKVSVPSGEIVILPDAALAGITNVSSETVYSDASAELSPEITYVSVISWDETTDGVAVKVTASEESSTIEVADNANVIVGGSSLSTIDNNTTEASAKVALEGVPGVTSIVSSSS